MEKIIRFGGRAGTAQFEYFVVATGVALASLWLWNNGEFQEDLKKHWEDFRTQQIDAIIGP